MKQLGTFMDDRRTVARRHVSVAERDFEGLILLGEYQDNLEESLLQVQQAITADVLAAHPAGYSTTAHDLLHDLIP